VPKGYAAAKLPPLKLVAGESRTLPLTVTSPRPATPPTGATVRLQLDLAGNAGEQSLGLIFTPALTCPRLHTAPTLDGNLDDPAWKEAQATGPFALVGTGGTPIEPTGAVVGYDDQYLYVGLHCTESQMGTLLARAPRNPGVSNQAVHSDDSIEVFLSPGRNREYVQLAANALGAQKMSKPVKMDAAAARGKGGWTVELRIAFSSLGAVPHPGDTWAVNFCRVEQRLHEISAWSPPARGFHEPERFGLLTFGG
jgi:hypothetical protein